MAYAKIDESGTVLERGLIRARVDMYLEPGDPGYDEHYVNVPDESSREFKAGYKGAVDAAGRPKDMDDYKSWLGSLPHVWRNNPFVCHFVRVGHEATTEQLAALAQEALDEFLAGRREGKTPNEVWCGKRRPVTLARNLDAAGQKKAEAKLATVKSLGTILAARGRRVE